MYRIAKLFIGGLLEGITITETTSVQFEIGFVCLKPIGGSPYKIINVEKLP